MGHCRKLHNNRARGANDNDCNIVIDCKPVPGCARSQRRREMWQNPGQGRSLHIPWLQWSYQQQKHSKRDNKNDKMHYAVVRRRAKLTAKHRVIFAIPCNTITNNQMQCEQGVPLRCSGHNTRLFIHHICHFFSTWHIFGYNFSPHKKRVNRVKTDFTVKQRKPLINWFGNKTG